MMNGVPLPKPEKGITQANDSSLKKARNLIQSAKKPIVLVGKGAVRQNAAKELQQLIEKLHIPTAHTFMSKGIVPSNHPLNFFAFGFMEKDYVVNLIRESDLIITVGFDIVEQLPKNWNIDKKPILHIHACPAEVDEYYPIAFELLGNIRENLSLLNKEEFTQKDWEALSEKRERIIQGHGIKSGVTEQELLLSNVINALSEVLNPNTILLSDVGAHKLEIARAYQPEHPNHVFISNGFASMGIALPGAIGAKLACPSQPVVCVTGDGGFLMNIAELETAKRLNTAMIILVLNDGMYGLEQKMMLEQQSSDEGVYFSNPEFVTLAESFGIKGYRVESIDELKAIMTGNLHLNEITLIDIPIRYK
jgi:acetolactate synthase-1/2/3 large subunit